MNLEEIKKSEGIGALEEKRPKKIGLLNILLIAFGIILSIGWFLIKSLADVMPLVKLLWPLVIGAIILGIAFAIWKRFAEQAKVLWGIDLFRKISQTVLLIGLAYSPFFYLSYGWLVPKLMKNIGFSYYHTLMIVTAFQLPIAGILYFLVSPIWPEKGKMMRGFLIVSLTGPLVIAYIMYQSYWFFDHSTGKNKIWVSDSEEKVYYSPGYGIEDGKILRPGTAADVEKFKREEESLRDRIDKLIERPKAKAQVEKPRRVSGIFKLPADETIVDKDITGQEIWYKEGEFVNFQQLGQAAKFTVINRRETHPTWTTKQERVTSGRTKYSDKVRLKSKGGELMVRVTIIS